MRAGRASAARAAVASGRDGRRTLHLLAFAAATAIGLTASGPASAASLPAVKITYSGTMSIEVFPAAGKPAHQLRKLTWTATADSAGRDGALPLDFASASGSSETDSNNNCYDNTTTLSLAAARNPAANAWFLNESSDYPSPGWKYSVSGAPSFVPVVEDTNGACGSSSSEQVLQVNEMLLKQETFSASQLAEYEALFDPLDFLPGKPATRTRSFSFDGISHCKCLPSETHVKESMTLTVSATSPASGNNIPTEAGKGGGPPGGKGAPPARRKNEARRRELKEQAREDLGPALEQAWNAHGLATAIGLNYGVALSNALDELGQQGALINSNDATARVINDYRIVKDPPDPRYRRLARPRTPRPPKLPSCAAAPSDKRTACTELRAAMTAMLTASARASADTAAMASTINRDSAAIRARDYSAAARQFQHFESLRKAMRAELRRRGAGGARVAAILRSLGVNVVLTNAESGAAIGAVEADLRRSGVPAASLRPLAATALQAHESDALAALARPTG